MHNIYLFKVFSTLINFVISIVLGILVPKAIGPEAFGQFNYIISTFTFLFQLLMLTSGTAYIYFLSSGKYKMEHINTLYMCFLAAVTLVVILLGCMSLTFEMGMSRIWADINNNALIYLGLVLGCLTNLQQRLLEYCDSSKQSIVADKLKVISKFLLASSVASLVFFDKLTVNLLMLISIMNILLFMVMFVYYIDFKLAKLPKKIVKDLFTDFYIYLKPLFLFTLVSAVYAYLGKFLLQQSGGAVEQGYYNFSLQLALIPVTFIASIMAIYMSDMTKKYQEHDVSGVKEIFSANIFKVYCIHACIALYLLINASDIISLVVGQSYIGATKSLQWLAIFSLCHTFGMLSGNLFLSTGRNKLYSKINIVVMLIAGTTIIITHQFMIINAVVLAFLITVFYMVRVGIQLYFNLNFLGMKKLHFMIEVLILTCIITLSLLVVKKLELNILLNSGVSVLILICVNFIFRDYLGLRKLISFFRS